MCWRLMAATDIAANFSTDLAGTRKHEIYSTEDLVAKIQRWVLTCKEVRQKTPTSVVQPLLPSNFEPDTPTNL